VFEERPFGVALVWALALFAVAIATHFFWSQLPVGHFVE
jgi:hypothetical protein